VYAPVERGPRAAPGKSRRCGARRYASFLAFSCHASFGPLTIVLESTDARRARRRLGFLIAQDGGKSGMEGTRCSAWAVRNTGARTFGFFAPNVASCWRRGGAPRRPRKIDPRTLVMSQENGLSEPPSTPNYFLRRPSLYFLRQAGEPNLILRPPLRFLELLVFLVFAFVRRLRRRPLVPRRRTPPRAARDAGVICANPVNPPGGTMMLIKPRS
jgi:hypothetical protein